MNARDQKEQRLRDLEAEMNKVLSELADLEEENHRMVEDLEYEGIFFILEYVSGILSRRRLLPLSPYFTAEKSRASI